MTARQDRDAEKLVADFAEITHVPVKYINNNLPSTGLTAHSLEATVTLLSDLENAATSASQTLDTLVDDMLRIAPRLGFEIELLKGELQGMKGTVLKAEPKRVALYDKGETTIARLRTLENVKKRMEETAMVFDEAQAWNPPACIEEPMNIMISNKEWAQASKLIVKYESLLQVWKNTAEYSKRKAVVDRLRKKVLDARQQDGISKASLDLARTSLDSQRSNENSQNEEGYYSSFIKRAFKN